MSEQGLAWNAQPDELQLGAPDGAVARGGPDPHSIGRRRGWVERFLGVADRGSSLSIAVVVGAVGAAAFVASLAYDWQRTVIDLSPRSGGGGSDDGNPQLLTYNLAASSIEGLGTVYVLMILALLGAVGVAVTWPHVAHRLRVAATGVGIGLFGILIAMTIRLPAEIGPQQGLALLPSEYSDRLTTRHEPGLYFAYATVALCVAALWVAAPSLRRAPTRTSPSTPDGRPYPYGPPPTPSTLDAGWAPSPNAPASHAPASYARAPQPPAAAPQSYGSGFGSAGVVSGLTVSPAEPIDEWHR